MRISIKFNYFHWSLSNNITATYKNNVRYKGYPNIARFLALQRKYTIGSSLRFHTIPSALEIYPAVQTSYLFKSDSLIFNLWTNDRQFSLIIKSSRYRTFFLSSSLETSPSSNCCFSRFGVPKGIFTLLPARTSL